MHNLASFISHQGRYQEAEKMYQQVLELMIKLKGPDHPNISTIMNNLAIAIES
jgi:cell division FtsZ-interacting protein ZapD